MFEITYYSQKDKQTVKRFGKHDDKSRVFQSKSGRQCYCYFDIEKNGYRTATDTWIIKQVA